MSWSQGLSITVVAAFDAQAFETNFVSSLALGVCLQVEQLD